MCLCSKFKRAEDALCDDMDVSRTEIKKKQ